MNTKKIETLVKPFYAKKDSMHNFKHIIRIKKKVKQLREDYEKIDENLLNFIIYFHGLKRLVNKNKSLKKAFPKKYLSALNRHTKNPKTIEEKLVSDANLLEAVGKFGIKKALQVSKERKQTIKKTISIIRKNINNVKFYTKKGKKLGNPGIKYIKKWLKIK